MIYTPVGGRLGNQLFYYAFARYLQINLKKEHELCFDFSNLIRHGAHYEYEKSGWEDSLQYFQTVPYHTYAKTRVCYRESSMFQRMLLLNIMLRKKFESGGGRKYVRDHQRWLSGKGLFYCINSPLGDITDITDYDFETDASDIFVRGAGETSSYLNTIRKELLQELVPRFPGLDRNKELYQAMEETNSVCISVRRGDYFSNPGVKEKFALCDREYFVRAVEKVKELVAQPVFFIFSDDIEWCRENLNLDVSDCFFERGDDPIWEKLRMMYSCKHFIISNSTFSWWAQWLGTFPGKVVVSPDRWYVKYTSALVEESFYRIQTGK